jgi:heme-degrading monooxygenase HmoA
MFVVVNKIAEPGANKEAVVEGFKRAVPGMKRFAGFVGMEIWTEQDGSLLAVSRWTSKEALEEYTNDALFRSHHGGARSEGSSSHNNVNYYEAEALI